ncbi:hypothetical protein LTR94_038499, partial [Friedmanniomyces endolithicus]
RRRRKPGPPYGPDRNQRRDRSRGQRRGRYRDPLAEQGVFRPWLGGGGAAHRQPRRQPGPGRHHRGRDPAPL